MHGPRSWKSLNSQRVQRVFYGEGACGGSKACSRHRRLGSRANRIQLHRGQALLPQMTSRRGNTPKKSGQPWLSANMRT
ncbi:hypothetical protein BN844_3230 [Pseudomonas sp. SHC52]|nr:hypothetical protein BN844_3230 [Pseudomonas sp. SHC52]